MIARSGHVQVVCHHLHDRLAHVVRIPVPIILLPVCVPWGNQVIRSHRVVAQRTTPLLCIWLPLHPRGGADRTVVEADALRADVCALHHCKGGYCWNGTVTIHNKYATGHRATVVLGQDAYPTESARANSRLSGIRPQSCSEPSRSVEASRRLSRSIGGLLGAMGLFSVGILSGLFWGILGPSWSSLGRVGVILGLGTLLGLSWGPLGSPGEPLGAILEAINQMRGGNVRPPSGAIKVAAWGALGALLGRSWAVLGPSCGPLGPLLELSWAILGPRHQKRIGNEKARRQTSLISHKLLKDFGISGRS